MAGSTDSNGYLKVAIASGGTISGDQTFTGNVTIDGEDGRTHLTAPVYVEGYFRSENLTGMDAAGLAEMQGRIVKGDLTTGLIRF